VRRSRPGGRRTDASLTSGEDFQSVYRAGSRHVSAIATVYVLLHERAEVRLGIPAGRRLGSAVDRNRLRRRLREAFGRVRPMIDRGADVVVVPRGQAMKAPFGELVDALLGALAAGGVIRKGRGAPGSAGEEAWPKQ